MILGTNLVCSEFFFCACLVGQGTNEQVFLKQTQPWTGKMKNEGSDETNVKPPKRRIETEELPHILDTARKPSARRPGLRCSCVLR